MNLLTPDPGLIFWMTLSFGIVVFILTKYGFPVIVKMVEERKAYIEESLIMAEKARTELNSVKEETVRLLAEANKEQVRIIQEASKSQERILNEARFKALEDANNIILKAREQIVAEKEESLKEIRHMVSALSIEIVKKVMRAELDNKGRQAEMISKLIDETTKRQS